VLDEAAIAAKLADTAAVSALLSTIFTDDEPTESADWAEDRHTSAPHPYVSSAIDPIPESVESAIAGLDAAHSKLLRQLAERLSWSRSDFEQLAAQLGLLPDAAMERLNDVALDTADDFILDGDEQLTVNPHTLQEMLV
jgi:hypothetical protein